MSYNRNYATRSGRYNNSGQFVSAGELESGGGAARGARGGGCVDPTNYANMYQQGGADPPQEQRQAYMGQHQQGLPSTPIKTTQQMQLSSAEGTPSADSACMEVTEDDASSGKPAWMKSKLQGVRKISNKERRRRQNETLRRLLTPKNALMVLNEMIPGEQLTNQFTVVPAATAPFYTAQHTTAFCADLTVEGNSYKGYGENKLSARNAAAEQAIRDLIIKRMSREGEAGGEHAGGEGGREVVPPMIQLASFALHKLFSEWEYEGHKVPLLKPVGGVLGSQQSPTPSESKGGKKPREVPEDAPSLHPCMLLTVMRPRLEYRELGSEGDKPQNMVFTMGVEVDGTTYVGKASSKKEARKAAARSACQALFGVVYPGE